LWVRVVKEIARTKNGVDTMAFGYAENALQDVYPGAGELAL
jgi:hypothetical protein